MKIAVPSRNSQVDSHFGHCEYFTVFTADGNKQIIAEEKVASPVSCGCKSNIATILAGQGVKVMLAGNMGDGAVNVLQTNGIKVIRGCSGDIKKVAEDFLNGEISDSGSSCEHDHEHSCHS
ncbi:MAG: dinitrogenase iron-molybdenum cofactor biosynthesis protein [Clostridiaceae bacterium BRH_c20a]|nr:MAG: dinitrogenase iron-molybdenum cofactor biosynthesis protein [Clostridiaceae bacterium BRH_c20a]